MKALPKLLILSAVLAMAGCGKNNESGKSGGGRYTSQYCVSYTPTGQCAQYQNYSINNINSGYSYNGVSLNQVQQENPCILSGGGWGQSVYNRTQVTVQVNMGQNIIPSGQMHVGVTSFGDVAALIGNGTSNPTFVAYLCPRPVSGQGTLSPQILIGSYSSCRVNPITAANMYFNDGSQANFRWPQGGSSLRQKFSFCQ